MGGKAEDRTKGAVLDGPKLAMGVDRSVAREGDGPAPGSWRGVDEAADSGAVVPESFVPVENTGAELMKDTNDGVATEW